MADTAIGLTLVDPTLEVDGTDGVSVLTVTNDIVANTSVLLAAGGVWLTNTSWPDILVGLALAGLFIRSSFYVLKESFSEYNRYRV